MKQTVKRTRGRPAVRGRFSKESLQGALLAPRAGQNGASPKAAERPDVDDLIFEEEPEESQR